MIKALRPGYQPSNHKVMGSTLLSKVNKEALNSLKLGARTKAVTVLQDGKSLITNGKKVYLLSTTDTGSEKKSLEYCAHLSKNAINEAKEKYKQRCFCFMH